MRCNELFKNVRTIKQASEIDSPSISAVLKNFGSEFIQAYLASWIVNINSFLNIRYPMNEQQIEETARLIINNFFNLTVVEIYLVINNAKMGIYGKFYDRLDGSMILSWFAKYYDERCDFYELLSIDQSNIIRGQIDFNYKNRR